MTTEFWERESFEADRGLRAIEIRLKRHPKAKIEITLNVGTPPGSGPARPSFV